MFLMLCKYHYCTQLTLLENIFQVLKVFDDQHGFLCVFHVNRKMISLSAHRNISRLHSLKRRLSAQKNEPQLYVRITKRGRTWWPCDLRRRSAAAWLLGSGIRIPLTAPSSLTFVVCFVESGLWYKLITRSEESYRVYVCASNFA
jgi:hypothetical protein